MGSRRYRGSRRQSHRRWQASAIAGFAVLALLAVAAFLAQVLRGGDTVDSTAAPTPTPDTTASPTPPTSPSPRPSPTPSPTPVLALTGYYPTDGPGTFAYATGTGEVAGRSGPLRRYRVAVEEGLADDVEEFAAFVEETLSASAGWTAGGDLRLQRVADGDGHDFTVYLATSGTTQRMCAAGGLDIIGWGLPEGGVSCRVPGQAIINYTRWRESVPHYVDSEVPLVTYRQMVINHEVGHELGYGHEGCPAPGELAPVMMQQTIRLDGCIANPWPYVDGVRHTGPPVP
ncbi:MAG TPA: DUF3152 domain-containing protein [Natronosporangium sp.]|jgi:hypothetical protein|nr:DUF3152 domain-containing protein [Natronosporangium sp.]